MAGKSPDQLRFKPDPDPRDTDWYRFVQDIDDLLATGRYTWAEDTLTDIQATVQRTERVTEGQRRAVRNIEEGATGRNESRRYRWRGSRN